MANAMNTPGDMWRVEYPDDTGPKHAPIDWPLEPLETEAPPMVKEADFVYVDLYGNEVAADDPAAQTKYSASELKAMRKGGFFPKRDGDAAPDAAESDAEGTPVLNSGVGTADDADDEKPAKAARK
jgi:hypothetical protein